MPDIKLKRQKIIKVGNSYAVTLDSEFVKKTGLKVGETMVASYQADQSMIRFSPKTATPSVESKKKKHTEKMSSSSSITPEFRQWVEKTLEEDKEAMETLANLE